MATDNLDEPFKVGALVKIRNSGYGRARIVELRGPLGPKGAKVYRVHSCGGSLAPAYIEVLENQLEISIAE